jgi:hypothetical protein
MNEFLLKWLHHLSYKRLTLSKVDPVRQKAEQNFSLEDEKVN